MPKIWNSAERLTHSQLVTRDILSNFIPGRKRRERWTSWTSGCQGQSSSFSYFRQYHHRHPYHQHQHHHYQHHQGHQITMILPKVEELEHVLRRSATTRLKEETKISFLREQLGSQVGIIGFLPLSESDIGPLWEFSPQHPASVSSTSPRKEQLGSKVDIYGHVMFPKAEQPW